MSIEKKLKQIHKVILQGSKPVGDSLVFKKASLSGLKWSLQEMKKASQLLEKLIVELENSKLR